MTLAQIQTAVRTATRIPTAIVSDAELLTWINEGLYRIAAAGRWPFLEDLDTFATTADQQNYVITTDIASNVDRIVSISQDGRPTRLQQIDVSTALQMYGDDPPSSEWADLYYLWENDLWLVPVPDTTSKQYNVHYYKNPTALAIAADTPEFDVKFHSLLAHYCEMRVWLHEEELQKAKVAEFQYRDLLNEMSKWYRDEAHDSPWGIGVPQPTRRGSNTPFTDGL